MTSNKLHYFSAGYNYYGTERLYSGVTGQEMEADIFMGIVYYQRLRHMVSDKFQVSCCSPSCGNSGLDTIVCLTQAWLTVFSSFLL